MMQNKKAKLLYVDVPFQGERGGDKNRSKFIWSAIKDEFEIDLLLIKSYKDPDYEYKPHTGQNQLFELISSKPGFKYPEAIMKFSTDQMKIFQDILLREKYDIIFIRFAAPVALADSATKLLPNVKIIIDIDMLMSRLTQLSWNLNPTLKNRYFFIQNKKFIQFEKLLFNKPYLFLFTNYLEMEMAMRNSVKPDSQGKLQVLPNVMQANSYQLPEKKKNYILFFGSLNSAANMDAFDFLTEEIYPLIAAKLQVNNTTIRIVGRNQTAKMEKICAELPNLNLVGEVDNIDKEIAESLFTILPIRIASGTRTRILEAANLKTAVLSTTIGAEGFQFEPDEITIKDSADDFAKAIINFLDRPEIATLLGENILKKSNNKYLDTVVAQQLVEQIKSWNPGGKI